MRDSTRWSRICDSPLSRAVIDVKLSCLEYALLPTTKVSIGGLVTSVSLKVATIAGTSMPFVSDLRISLVEIPDLNVRITPLSDERYEEMDSNGCVWLCFSASRILLQCVEGNRPQLISNYTRLDSSRYKRSTL